MVTIFPELRLALRPLWFMILMGSLFYFLKVFPSDSSLESSIVFVLLLVIITLCSLSVQMIRYWRARKTFAYLEDDGMRVVTDGHQHNFTWDQVNGIQWRRSLLILEVDTRFVSFPYVAQARYWMSIEKWREGRSVRSEFGFGSICVSPDKNLGIRRTLIVSGLIGGIVVFCFILSSSSTFFIIAAGACAIGVVHLQHGLSLRKRVTGEENGIRIGSGGRLISWKDVGIWLSLGPKASNEATVHILTKGDGAYVVPFVPVDQATLFFHAWRDIGR